MISSGLLTSTYTRISFSTLLAHAVTLSHLLFLLSFVLCLRFVSLLLFSLSSLVLLYKTKFEYVAIFFLLIFCENKVAIRQVKKEQLGEISRENLREWGNFLFFYKILHLCKMLSFFRFVLAFICSNMNHWNATVFFDQCMHLIATKVLYLWQQQLVKLNAFHVEKRKLPINAKVVRKLSASIIWPIIIENWVYD